MKRSFLVAVVLLTLIGLSVPLLSQAKEPGVPQHRLSYENLTVVRYNPKGAQDEFKLNYRYRLYGQDPSLLFQECEFLVGPTAYLTPAFVRLGGRAGIRPLAILYLEARMDWMASFGTLGYVVGFPSALEDASDAVISDSDAIQTTGRITTLTAELRAKVRSVVVRSRGAMIHSKMELEAGDNVWYEGINDVLMPADGWMLHVDSDLLWMDGGPLIFGVRHTLDYVFYPSLPGVDSSLVGQKTPNHRFGLLAAYRFRDAPGAAFDRPTVAVIVNWHLKHPYRAGQEINQAMPYILVAFAFRGDLFSSND